VKADDFQWIETSKSSDGGKVKNGFAKYHFGDDFPKPRPLPIKTWQAPPFPESLSHGSLMNLKTPAN
jgi:hypothetical protein